MGWFLTSVPTGTKLPMCNRARGRAFDADIRMVNGLDAPDWFTANSTINVSLTHSCLSHVAFPVSVLYPGPDKDPRDVHSTKGTS